MWNYDQKEIQKKFSMVRSQDGWAIANMEKKIVFCQKINLVAAYTQRIIVQPEYKKELHY